MPAILLGFVMSCLSSQLGMVLIVLDAADSPNRAEGLHRQSEAGDAYASQEANGTMPLPRVRGGLHRMGRRRSPPSCRRPEGPRAAKILRPSWRAHSERGFERFARQGPRLLLPS